ncbi:MAG: EAL domain-containing protein, partial [Sphingopyxis sp.]|nr:EAL domain-containing protein [Sphingopyxis sp.]
DIADQIRHAQIALKRAKRTDRIEIYEPEAAILSDNRFGLETELRNAIEEDRLRLDFQPLIELSTGTVAGFEALARWNNSKGVSVPPTEFIPIAEDSGLIVPLGQWAIGKAAATLADWDRKNANKPVDCYISVNVSAIQLVRDDIAAVVREALSANAIGGDRLMIELTESAIIGDPDLAMSVLSELKALDARVAMDDFGTGYSNLAYLQRLPLDVLKIDRSFVDHMVEDRDKAAIVRTIQSLAEVLGMRTTAEGVETADQARLLSALGCDFGQGYLFAHPMDTSAALAYWRQSLLRPII